MIRGYCSSIQCLEDCTECIEREGEEMENEICSIGHEEIVYFSGRCPLCEALYRIEAYHDCLNEVLQITEPEEVRA